MSCLQSRLPTDSISGVAEFHGTDVDVTNDSMVYAVQFIGCSLEAHTEKMTVDAQAKLPSSGATAQINNGTWSAWNVGKPEPGL